MRHRGVETKCTLHPCSAGVIHSLASTYAARTYGSQTTRVTCSAQSVLGGGGLLSMGGANPAPVAEAHGDPEKVFQICLFESYVAKCVPPRPVFLNIAWRSGRRGFDPRPVVCYAAMPGMFSSWLPRLSQAQRAPQPPVANSSKTLCCRTLAKHY